MPPRPALPPAAGAAGWRRLVTLTGLATLIVALLAGVTGATGTDGDPTATPPTAATPGGSVAVAGGRPAMASTGAFAAQPGTGPVVGAGRLVRYRVEVETGVPVTAAQFAAAVDEALQHPRGWTRADGISLQRTDSPDASITVTLASPRTTDRLCRPLRTHGRFSCFNAGRAVVNADRWLLGADTYAGDLAAYRHYVVNHEVGHGLGHGHRGCPAPGAPAPVMVQQTKSLYGCARNPWPVTGG